MSLFNKFVMTLCFVATLMLSASPVHAQRGRVGGGNHGGRGGSENRITRPEQRRERPNPPQERRERPNNPREQHPDRDQHREYDRDQRRGPRYEGENHAHRYHRDHDRDVRYYPNGIQVIRYGGIWFAALYPEWVWTDEVYFVEIAPGEWVVVDYDNPAFSASVYIVY